MKIIKLVGTCSMAELFDVYVPELTSLSKSKFRNLVDLLLEKEDIYGTKVLVYNTNAGFLNRLILRFKFGFSSGYSYTGNIRGKRVTTMFLKLK